MAKILFVEDDLSLGSEVKEWLEDEEGLAVEWATNGEDALQLLGSFGFDLIILDWELPGVSGLSVCEQYRKNGGQTPILFLTGRGEFVDKEKSFGQGADDYMTKPYDVRELSLRCRALLRRARQSASMENKTRGIVLRPDEKTLLVQGKAISLTTLECGILRYFMTHPGKVFSSTDLLKAVWPSDKDTGEESVRSLIKGLRKKLDQLEASAAKDLIETVGRSGYRYIP